MNELVDASELRIGNWIKGSIGTAITGEFQVEAWHFTAMTEFQKTAGRFVNWEPIILTEEWLFKFDITRGEKYNIPFCDGILHRISIGYNFIHAGILLSRVKYVHRLQNLVFALENKELTIKI